MAEKHDDEYEKLASNDQISFEFTDANDEITFKQAAREIIWQSIPAIIGFLCEFIVQVVNYIFAGHLNDPALLGGVGLGNLLINITGLSISIGLNGAIDTLVSQAYGDKQYYLGGGYLNRGRIVQGVFFIPQIILLSYTKEILISLGQEEASADAAYTYVVTFLPGLFAMTQFETLRRYLQNIGIFKSSMYTQGIAMAFHILFCYLFVFKLQMGVAGISFATGITFWLDLIILTLYVHFKTDLVPRESWHFFNADSFKNLLEYLKYGVPAALMLGMEWWSFEILSLYSGWLSINELAANVVLFNLIALLYQFPLGMTYAVGNLVGNSLGSLKPNHARKYCKTSVALVIIIAGVLISIIISFRHYVPMMYTQDKTVIDLAASTIPVFSIMIFFDFTQGVLAGGIRAAGYQNVGTIVTLVAYWGAMLPMSYVIAFILELRLIGIWLGTPFGSIITSTGFSFLLLSLDWQKLSTSALERIRNEKKELDGEQELSSNTP